MICVLEDAIVCELELALLVPLMELGDITRALLCVEETWLDAVAVTGMLVGDNAEVETEADIDCEEVIAELEETAVEDAPSSGVYFPRRTRKTKLALAVAFPEPTELLWVQESSLMS